MKLSTKIVRAVAALNRAVAADSWKGSAHPSEVPEIERKLKLAERRFKDLMARVDSIEQQAKDFAP